MRGEAAPGGDRGHGHQLAEDIPEGGPDAEEHGAGQVAEGPQKVLYDDTDKYPVARFELWRLYMTDKDTVPVQRMTQASAANRLIGEGVQSRRKPLLGPSPG